MDLLPIIVIAVIVIGFGIGYRIGGKDSSLDEEQRT